MNDSMNWEVVLHEDFFFESNITLAEKNSDVQHAKFHKFASKSVLQYLAAEACFKNSADYTQR